MAETERSQPPLETVIAGNGAAGLSERLVTVKRTLIGRPLATGEMEERLLPKFLALPIFASDPLSSVAYATEAALFVLVAASLAGRHYVFPISIAIAAFLTIVVLSYTQTVRAYSTSGGAYVVAKDNLGTLPALVAAAALLTDYVLTVAVSVAAGIVAVTSAAPGLYGLRVELSLACVGLIMLVNLRGVREAGMLFALPTYGFVAALYAMIGAGLVKCATGACPEAAIPHPVTVGAGTVGLFVLLRAFASGSTALTGVEAISNGVSAFRHPQSKNAARTMLVMGAMAVSLFLGVSYLAVKVDARPSQTASVLSEIARAVFPASSGGSFMYFAVQGFTFAILILAANTSYQGFPRLAAIMARDGFFPRQFSNLGDRLVLSNGMFVLTALAGFLIWVYHANVDSLIHLYVLGVFTSFTLSQAGMVRYWFRTRAAHWRRSAVINGVGAATTGLVTAIVVWTKFGQGAWMVIAAIPVMVLLFAAIHRHYRMIARRLRAGADAVLAQPILRNTVVLYLERFDAAAVEATWYARAISGGDFHAIHVPREGSDPHVRLHFSAQFQGNPRLEVLTAQDGPVGTVLEYLWALPHGEANFVTVVIPELLGKRSLPAALLRRTTFFLKMRLLYESGVAITSVPRLAQPSDAPFVPKRAVGVVPISGVHAASLRAVAYAQTLGLTDTKAVFFAFDDAEAEKIEQEWERRKIELPLEIREAPFRDLSGPLLSYLRAITADPEAVAVVVMPELVVRGWTPRLLHNQRALYIKRLLLFEPRVILSSVPYQLL